jgi:hypothetical protein
MFTIARTNHHEYNYLEKDHLIATKQRRKADRTFTYNNGICYKELDAGHLSDIYTVRFFVTCKNDETVFELNCEQEKLPEEKVILSSTEYTSGWREERGGIFTKEVQLSDISDICAVYTYKKEGGKALLSEIEERLHLSFSEFHSLYHIYKEL